MKYLFMFFLVLTTYSIAEPANRGYGDLFFRTPPSSDNDTQYRNRDRQPIYSYPNYYYDSPDYYYQSPGYNRNYDPFPDATRAKEIFNENVKR